MKETIENYRIKLLDNSQRNPLLFFSTSLFKAVTIHTSFNFLEKAVNEEMSIEVGQAQFQSSLNEDNQLEKLWALQKTGLEEKGFNFIHLIFGIISFKEEKYRFPIFVLPVEIHKRNLGLDYYLTFPEESSELPVNPLLINFLEKKFTLPPDFWEGKVLDKLKLLPEIQFMEECFLGAIDNSSFLIYKDLDPDSWQSLLGKESLDILFGEKISLISENKISVDENPWFLPLDSSQKQSLMNSLNKTVTVIQGPPGTGKTQAICNLALKLVEQDKKVLIVSQKQVALEVVLERISQIGLGDLALILNYKHSKMEFVESLRNSFHRRKKIKELTPLDPLKISVDSKINYAELEQIILLKNKISNIPLWDFEISSINKWLEIEGILLKFPHLQTSSLKKFILAFKKLENVLEIQNELLKLKSFNKNYWKICKLSENKFDNLFLSLESVELSWWERLNSEKRRQEKLWEERQKVVEQTKITEAERLELSGDLSRKEIFNSLKNLSKLLGTEDLDETILSLLLSEKETLLDWSLLANSLETLDSKEKDNLWLLVERGGVGKFKDFLNLQTYSSKLNLASLQKNQHYLVQLEGEAVEQVKKARIRHREVLLNDYRQMLGELLKKYQTTDWLKFLFKQFSYKRKFANIRTFFKMGSKFLIKVKPIMLMSPTGVANYLPQEEMFDVVIFDEASQLKTHESLPAILRSKKVIIVGDEQQLPPSNFFSQQSQEDESLLDLANSRIEHNEKLLWHYRSENPELIKVSNDFFYNHELRTFPSIKKDSGIVWIYHPETKYDRGQTRTNLEEADILIADLINLLKEYPHKSFGVATLNLTQKELLEEKFSKVRSSVESELAQNSQPIFFKNLENIQGDERDFILLSLGYSKNGEDKLELSLGPLLRGGGEKRLNVLFTRAKFQLRLYSAIRAVDLDRSENRGVSILKEYLEYAEFRQEINKQKEENFIGSLLGKATQSHPLIDFIYEDKAVISEKTLFTNFSNTEDREIFLSKLIQEGFKIYLINYLSLIFSLDEEIKSIKTFIEKSDI